MKTGKRGVTTILRQHEASWVNWGTLQCNLHWIYEGRIGNENLHGTFNTTSIAAWLLEKGTVRLTRNQQTQTVSPGNWIIILPGTHIQEFSADAEILSIRFDINWPDNRQLFDRDAIIIFPSEKYPNVTEQARVVVSKAKKVIQNKDPFDLELTNIVFPKFIRVKAELWLWVEHLYTALLSEKIPPTRIGVRDNRVAEALQKLKDVPLSNPVKLEEIARQVGLGKARLSQLFQEETGVTPSQYMNNRRINYARKMIENPSIQIKNIAYDLGFSRLSDFSSWFKKHFNGSPREYRSQRSGPAL